jgi:hypothetical protein
VWSERNTRAARKDGRRDETHLDTSAECYTETRGWFVWEGRVRDWMRRKTALFTVDDGGPLWSARLPATTIGDVIRRVLHRDERGVPSGERRVKT